MQERPPIPAIVGRDAARAEIDTVLEAVARGRRGLLIVEGEAGIGKTSLLRQVLAARRTTVVWATGDETELEVDLGVVDQLTRAAPLAAAERAEILAPFPRDPVDVGASMVRLLDGIELDPARPLVVVVDDAQWADVASLRALTFAARRLQRDAVLLCLVVRPEGRDHLPSGLVRLVEDEGSRVVLEPLDRAAVGELTELLTGRRISAAATKRLHEHTGGNPLYLRTLLAELPVDALDRDGDLPPPRSFSTLVVSRLAGAGADVAALAAAVAVLGEPAQLVMAAALAELAAPGSVIDAAVEHGLLQVVGRDGTDGPSLAFAHPLVRAAVLEDLPPGRRADLHRRAGSLVRGAAGLRHRLLGSLEPDGALWREATDVARDESARGNHGSAASLLRAAMAIAPSEHERAYALHEAVDQLLLAGRLEDARALRDDTEATPPSSRRSYVLGRLSYIVGPRRSARELLVAAWVSLVGDEQPEIDALDLAPDDRALAGRIAAMLATTYVDRADGAGALPWCRAALALDRDEAARTSTAHMLAGAWALIGAFDEGLADLDALCATVEAAAPPSLPAVADARSARGLLRLWNHDLARAGEDLEASLAAAATGSFVGRETARAYLAEVRYRQGRWDDALLLARLSASIVDDTDHVWMAALPHAAAVRPCAARGEATAEHLERASAAAQQVGGGVAAGIVLVASVEVAACARDLAGVLAAGDVLQSGRRPVDDRIAPWRATYVEALVTADRLDDAKVVAEVLASDPGNALLRTDAARVRIAVAAIRGHHDEVDAAADAALAEEPADVGPYPRARLELAVGRVWRRRGERRRAAVVLEAALGRFRDLGAVPWVEQVEAELRASGLKPRRGAARAGAELTPQEHQVAHLVVQGQTNREVGAVLVVSAKTVEHHLSRIYAKLGVRSRTELAHRLAPDR